MLAAAPAAPLAPEVPFAVVGIGVVAMFLVMLGLKTGYDNTLGALLRELADALRHVRFIGGFLAGKVDAIDHRVESALASGLLATETVLGKWWQYQKQVAEWTYDSLVHFTSSTVGAFDSLVHGTIPQAATAVVAPVRGRVGALTRALRAETARLENQLVRKANAIYRTLEQDFGRAWRGIDHIQRVELGRLWHRVAGVEADVAGLEHAVGRVIPHRLTRLEKWLGAGVIGGAAVAALTRVFPYWQCSNVKRFNRNVCRSPLGSLDWLFGLLALVFTLLNPEEVAGWADDTAEFLTEAWWIMAGVPESDRT